MHDRHLTCLRRAGSMALLALLAGGCEASSSTHAAITPAGASQSLRRAWGEGERGAQPAANTPSGRRCAASRSIEGTWISEPYGLALHATATTYALYEVSESSCFLDVSGALETPCEPELRINLGEDEDPRFLYVQTDVRGRTLTVRDAATTRYELQRTARLPRACRGGVTPPSDDPVLNFELFHEHFDEHYAFFALHGVDWDAQYARYRPQVTARTSPEQLFAIMSRMLAPLADYHVSLASEGARYGRPPPADIVEHAPAIDAYLLAHYLEGADVARTGNGLLSYRMMEQDIGYIGVWAMTGFADPAALAAGEDLVASELEGAALAIDEALAALSSARALIVDVRFNRGGMDGVALAIAARFADRERLAYWKVTRDGRWFTRPRAQHVMPTGEPIAKPVRLLTSKITLSAAEIFVLAMRVLPNVTVIGEATAGAHSDILTRTLANGWELGLSNEIYVAADGAVYEGRGIPAAVPVALDAAGFAAERDAIMVAALSALRE